MGKGSVEVSKNQEKNRNQEVTTKSEENKKEKNSIINKLGNIHISNKAYAVIRYVVLGVAALVLIYSSYSLTNSYLDYKEDEAKYAEINDMFQQENETSNHQDTKKKTKSMDYSSSITTWVWDYKAMLQYNDEAKGYIKLDGTRIQYPIVEHKDNDFYLKRGSDKVSNGAGAIFLDYRTAGLDGRMCILYGHNMMDGSMFKELMNYREDAFAKKHQTFDIYVGYRHYIYYVFSAFSTKDDNDAVYKFGFEDDNDYQKWLNTVSGKSRYKFDNPLPDINDKVILCSTCVDNSGNRQIVCMYRGEEVVD